MSSIFKKALPFSLLGHLAVFGIFSLTFGSGVALNPPAQISFLGQLINPAELKMAFYSDQRTAKGSNYPLPQYQPLPVHPVKKEYDLEPAGYFKPAVTLSLDPEKVALLPKTEYPPLIRLRKEPSIMLYPVLPYHFLLYFKDRQTVHIEVSFMINPQNIDALSVKRKISSGNLEVDLLVMRHIKHYLFVQQNRLPKEQWQTVKIDLSPYND